MKRILSLWLAIGVLLVPALARAQDEVPATIDEVVRQTGQHEGTWIPVAAIAIWLVVQIVKQPSIPIPLPPYARPLIAVLLGQVYGLVIEGVVNGQTWMVAIVRGLLAAGLPVFLHEVGSGAATAIKKAPVAPPGAASLLMLVLGGATGGCGSPLATAVHVADAGAAAADAAKPVLEQSCVEPMARAARLHDNDLALAVAAKCDGPMIAYESLRIAHVALRGAILEVYAGRSVEAALLAQVPTVAAAGARLAAAVQKLATGTVTQ